MPEVPQEGERPQPGVSSLPSPKRLLRVDAISEAFTLQDEDARRRAGLQRDDATPGPVMVELNLLHAKGLPGAKERFRRLYATVMGEPVTDQAWEQHVTPISSTY